MEMRIPALLGDMLVEARPCRPALQFPRLPVEPFDRLEFLLFAFRTADFRTRMNDSA
jgi:hypothetical protein